MDIYIRVIQLSSDFLIYLSRAVDLVHTVLYLSEGRQKSQLTSSKLSGTLRPLGQQQGKKTSTVAKVCTLDPPRNHNTPKT